MLGGQGIAEIPGGAPRTQNKFGETRTKRKRILVFEEYEIAKDWRGSVYEL